MPDISGLHQFSFTFEWCKSFVTFLKKKDRNLHTFQPLLASKAMSKGMAAKAASTGLTYRHLYIAFQRQGQQGIKALLGEPFSGSVRVTKNTRVISSLVNHFTVENP